MASKSGPSRLMWSRWLRIPRQLPKAKAMDKRTAEIYKQINGDKIIEAGNNALRILELVQPLRLCPERFIIPFSTLEALKGVRVAETDFHVLQRFFDKLVTNQTITAEEFGSAREIFRNMGLSLTQLPESGLFEIHTEGSRAAAERSASDARKLNVVNLLREPTAQISLRVSNFTADFFERSPFLLSEEESAKLNKNITLLRSGIEIEKCVQRINSILAPGNLKLKMVRPGAYELTSRATLTILSGPSGSGKGTAIQPLINEGLLKLTFFTCRPPRGATVDRPQGEFHGMEYFFISEREFQERLLQHGFFVAGYGVHGKHQGIHRKIFETVLNGHSLYSEMDIHLTHQILEQYAANGIDIRNIFLLPPEYREHLERLIGRYIQQSEFSGKPVDVADVAKRAGNGVDEILTSITLPPASIFIVNDVIEQTSTELRKAIEWMPAPTLLDPEPDKIHRISGKITIRKYRELALAQENLNLINSDMLVLNLDPEVLDRFRATIVFKLTSPSRTTQDTVVRIASEAAHSVREAVWKSMGWKIKKGTPRLLDTVPNMGMQVGTLSPFHYGHISASYAGLLSANLSGVVIMPGGETYDKHFALSAEHREKMVILALQNRPGIYHSPLRIEVAEYFKDMTDATLGSKGFDRKLALDLIAFNWLIAMNPHVNWAHYLVGIDKVNDYGTVKGEVTIDGRKYELKGKDEKSLIEETLAKNDIGIQYFERDGMKNIIEEVEPADSWLQELIEKKRQEGQELFTLSRYPSFNVSATTLRKLLEEFDPLVKDALDPRIINYIYKPLAEKEYTDPSGKQKPLPISILQAFILEAWATGLGRRLNRGGLNESQLEEIKKELEEINIQKKILAEHGILANGKPLTLEELKKL